jgi:hypothetical protein
MCTPVAWADAELQLLRDGGTFQSASKAVQAVIGGGVTFFTVFVGKKKKYESTPEKHLAMGRLLVADDKRYVTWILSERFAGKGIPQDLPALIFYVDGKPVKQYTLPELLVRTHLISESVSHTQWVFEHRNPSRSPLPDVVFAPDGSRLEFETTSLRRYVFNPRDGRMIEGDDMPLYKKADLIVYGECKRTPSGQVQLAGYGYVKGGGSKTPIVFSDPTGTYISGWHTVPLKKEGSDGWAVLAPATDLPVIYNTLPDVS